MIETVVLGTIFGLCGLLTWAAMKKYNSRIERRLNEIDAHTNLVAERKSRK